MGKKVIWMQRPVELHVRFKDKSGAPVEVPGYRWAVYMYGDKESMGTSVVSDNGKLMLKGNVAEGSGIVMDSDGCGMVVRFSSAAIGDGIVRLKMVAKDVPCKEVTRGSVACTDIVVLSLRHKCRIGGEVEEVERIEVDMVVRNLRWMMMSEDGKMVVTETGEKMIDLMPEVRIYR